MTTINVWNVEIATIDESAKKTEWRKIGVNLMWHQVLEVKRKYKGFITRHVRANNNGAECPTCGAFGGHWLSCKLENAKALRDKRRPTKRSPDAGDSAASSSIVHASAESASEGKA